MNMERSPAKGVSPSFAQTVAERVQRLQHFSEQHGIDLDPSLAEKAEVLRKKVGARCGSSVSTASDHSTSVRTVSKHRFSSSEALDQSPPADLSQSFSSSVYSTTSQKETARRLAHLRTKELKQIREESRSVQHSLRKRVRELKLEAVGALSPASDFEQELEFYDGQLEQMKQVVSSYVTEPHSCERSPRANAAPPLFTAQDPLLTELLSLRADIAALRSRVLAQEAHRVQTDGTSKALEGQLSTLRTNMEELTDRLRYDDKEPSRGKCECAVF